MATHAASSPGHAWHSATVVTFAGQSDTHIETGEDYPTRTLASIFEARPTNTIKSKSAAFIPSSYSDFDARNHKRQKEAGRYVTLAGDIDGGNHALASVAAAVREFAAGCAWLIYSSPHAREDDRRWRVILPLDAPASFSDWNDAQWAFFNFMEDRGIAMDGALARAAQPVYLPNVPSIHAKTGARLRGEDGEPLFYATETSGLDAPALRLGEGHLALGMRAIRERRAESDAERERVRAAAERKRAQRTINADASIIADFNQGTSVETMLELCGFEQSPRHGEDWRSPHQTGETYATRVFGDRWISLSGSDTAAGMGEKCASGCYGDAYDLYVHFKHGGDHKAAFRALHAERRAATGSSVVYGVFTDPPEIEGDPGWQEMPEWADIAPVADDMEAVTLQAGVEPQSGAPLPLIWAKDVQPVLSGNWIVKKVVPADGFVSVIGEPGCGKSFFILDLCCHVAADMPWRGRKVARGLVVYLAAEGQRGQMNRVEAWKREHGVADMPFALIPVAVNLRDTGSDLPKLIATIEAAIAAAGMPLSMLVVDTLNRSFGGGDENGEDMGAYVTNADKLRHHFGCTTIHVHHIPKNGELTERGHGSLRGAIDTSLGITTDSTTGIRTLICLKQKDGEDGWRMNFKLRRIVLGVDEDGDEVTTCVTEPQDDTDAPAASKDRGPNLSATQRLAYNELLATIEAAGSPVPRDIPDDRTNRIRVGKVALRKVWFDRWKAIAGADMPKDTASATFRRAVTDLVNKGLVGAYNDHVWATHV